MNAGLLKGQARNYGHAVVTFHAIDVAVCVQFPMDEDERDLDEHGGAHARVLQVNGMGLVVLGRVAVRCQSLAITRQHAL